MPTHPQTGKFLAAFGLVAVSLFFWATTQSFHLFAVGCDSFGYARQAELFRQNGILRGLDTRINNADAKFLIEAAEATEKDTGKWFQAVAPHCHYYQAAVGHVILQYPPGTGFMLSWFPEGRSLALLYVSGMALVTAVFLGAALMGRLDAIQFLFATSVLAVIDWAMKQPESVLASASAPATIILVPLCALLTLVAFPGSARVRPLIAFALGLVGGLLFSIRPPNMLLLVGVATAILVNSIRRGADLNRLALAIASGLGGFAISGAFPVLTADWINAGNPFISTYTSADISAPIFRLGVIGDRLDLYLGHSPIAPISIAAVLALIARLSTARSYPPIAGRFGLSIGALVNFGLSLAFFSTHQNMQPYYMLPAGVLTLCLVTFEIMISLPRERPSRKDLKTIGIAIASLLIVATWRIYTIRPAHYIAELPKEVTDPNAIVWADISSGTAYYYDHKYAAKLLFAGECTRDRLVHQVFERGRDQYFIDDSPTMKQIISQISKFAPMQPAGLFRTYQNLPVFKLSANATWTGALCSSR
jgi:hypothetical protein